MRDLLTHIKAGAVPDVAGIYYRMEDKIIGTSFSQLIKDIDTLPMPAIEVVFKKGYRYRNRRMEIGNRVAPIITSRGCPWNCSFCYKGTFGTSYRRRSPQNVIKEIIHLKEHYKINDIQFIDDLFAVNKNWLRSFCDELKNNRLKISWKCLGRVDTLDDGVMAMMKSHGCYGIEFGVESGDDEVLKDINKKITLQEVRTAFKQARENGLMTSAYFIYGNRLDTYATILKTMNFAKEIKADFCGFAILLPFPGTNVYEMLDENQKKNWSLFGGYYSYKSQISICSLEPQELRYYGKISPTEYYGRISYLFNNIIFSRHHILIKKNQLLFFIFHFVKKIYYIFKGISMVNRESNYK